MWLLMTNELSEKVTCFLVTLPELSIDQRPATLMYWYTQYQSVPTVRRWGTETSVSIIVKVTTFFDFFWSGTWCFASYQFGFYLTPCCMCLMLWTQLSPNTAWPILLESEQHGSLCPTPLSTLSRHTSSIILTTFCITLRNVLISMLVTTKDLCLH